MIFLAEKMWVALAFPQTQTDTFCEQLQWVVSSGSTLFAILLFFFVFFSNNTTTYMYICYKNQEQNGEWIEF